MSPRAAAEFGKQWPALQRRLKGFLRNKGVPAGEVDDLVQEVATRLLSYWHKVDRTKPVWPLAATIALNLLRDRSRRPDLEILGELPEMPGSNDAADVGIARLELQAVLRAMDALTPSQRAALLQAVEPADGSRSTSAEKMLRVRARRRLANAVGRACGGLTLKTRRIADALSGMFSKADGVAQALACATCLFVASAGSAALYPPLDGYGSDMEVDVQVVAPSIAEGPASTPPIEAFDPRGVELLRPDRLPDAAGRARAGDAASRLGSSGADTKVGSAGADAGAQPAGLALSGDATTVPTNAPVPAPGTPGTPDAPDQPPAPPSVEVDSAAPAQPPVQPPSGGDTTLVPVGTLTAPLEENAKP